MSLTKPMFDHEYLLRIYWEDTDAGGIVYYANYLKFFERGRTEWLRTLGINQQRMREDSQTLLVVGEVRAKYLRSARLDDQLLIATKAKQIGRASIVLEQKAFRTNTLGELLCEAEVKIGCIDATTMTPVRFPSILATALLSV
ncbi:MAG: tol-pal system-associated acyl-CoA thioesterase [Saezia sp.]